MQAQLFDGPSQWELEWQGMPEYNNVKQDDPAVTLTFKFRTQADYELFYNHIKEHLFNGVKPFDGRQTKTVKTTWFPLKEKAKKYVYEDDDES